MKLAIFATIFAALASSGYAGTPEAPGMEAALANNVQVETPEATIDAGVRALRGHAEEEVGAKATEEKPAGKKRGLKNEDPYGQTCTLCCGPTSSDDDCG
jgi:hypothetical protein